MTAQQWVVAPWKWGTSEVRAEESLLHHVESESVWTVREEIARLSR